MNLGKEILKPRTFFSFLLSILIIVYILHKIDLIRLWSILGQTNIPFYFIAFFTFYLSILIKAYRWQILLKNINIGLTLKNSLSIYYLSMFANSLVPAKLGDVYRGYLLKKKTAMSMSSGFGTVFVERIFDLAAMICLLFVSAYIVFRANIPVQIIFAIKWAAIIMLGLICSIFIFFGVNRHINIKFDRLKNVLKNFELGLRIVNFKTFLHLFVLSFIAWSIEGLTVYFIFLSLGLKQGILFGIFSDLSSSLLTAIPVTPSGLGVVEYALIYILKLKGIDENMSFAILILFRLISYFSIVFLGAFLFYLYNARTEKP